VNSPTVADAVRDFYSQHPYPPPVKSLDRYREKWKDPQRRKADFHLFEPTKPFHGRRKILVAGCGTSQAAKYALRWPSAQITGIDVSTTSIKQTQLLKQDYKLDNLALHEMAIEKVSDLGESFDHIVCTGVLHHLPDPNKGLRALRDVLFVDGSMQLMVYAPYGRAGIYLIQDYCRRLGVGTTSDEIGDLAECLGKLPPNHPLVPILRAVPDADQEAALADALLNPQDRPYSVEEFFGFLDMNGLTFGRWTRQAEYSAHCGSLRNSPHAKLFDRLTDAETSAAVELYRGTLLRHSAVVYREDRVENVQPIRFDTHGWLNFVPIRQPDSLCVRERLPEGAAAVLINPAHTQTDIYLPVSQEQLRMFERIDGRRSAGKISGSARGRSMARDLFEMLWHHDQIVFDASGKGATISPSQAN
jgi:SAM-dependent methyltransferase